MGVLEVTNTTLKNVKSHLSPTPPLSLLPTSSLSLSSGDPRTGVERLCRYLGYNGEQYQTGK